MSHQPDVHTSHHPDIHPGMPVYGSDGRLVGAVTNITDDGFTQEIHIEGGYLVPGSAVERVADGCVYLPNPAALYHSQLRAPEREDEAHAGER